MIFYNMLHLALLKLKRFFFVGGHIDLCLLKYFILQNPHDSIYIYILCELFILLYSIPNLNVYTKLVV